MKKYILIIIGLALVYFVSDYFINKDRLILRKTSLTDFDEIDTLNFYPDRHLYVLGLIKYQTFGRFTYRVGISKQDAKNPSISLAYKIENSELNEFEVSKDFFIKTKESIEKIDTINKYNKEDVFRKIELLFYANKKDEKLKFSPSK